ncbi:MAG: hypothetical protein GY938_15120 [Ketobacter sp.]|nr:hypothetical protein [Ketobacter sp.]
MSLAELLIRRSESAELGGFQSEHAEFEVLPRSFLSTRSRALPLPPTPSPRAFAAKPREVENENRECSGGGGAKPRVWTLVRESPQPSWWTRWILPTHNNASPGSPSPKRFARSISHHQIPLPRTFWGRGSGGGATRIEE